jgi:hypothetical protein
LTILFMTQTYVTVADFDNSIYASDIRDRSRF